jgi:hypothetical protein
MVWIKQSMVLGKMAVVSCYRYNFYARVNRSHFLGFCTSHLLAILELFTNGSKLILEFQSDTHNA